MTRPETIKQAIRLLQNGKSQNAAKLCERILNVAPDDFDALHLSGVASAQGGNLRKAVTRFRRAAELRPDSAAVLNNLGNVLRELEQHQEAVACLESALALHPEFPDALNNLGTALMGLHRHADAITNFRKALELRPNLVEAYSNLATALLELDEYEEAGICFQKALELRPNFTECHFNLGNTLRKLGQDEAALVSYKKVLALDPNRSDALFLLADQKRRLCDWRDLDELTKTLRSWVRSGRELVSPFSFLSFSDDPAEQLLCARRYSEDKVAHPALLPPLVSPDTSGPIRLAYLSADFREHPLAHLTAEMFERHDRRRFEIHAFSFGPDTGDDMRKRLVATFDHFHDVHRKSDQEVAQLIRTLEIHIAVDLMGYTKYSRPSILAYRPAPIQVSYLGYPGTMGADFIDYILVDHFIAPNDHQPFFTEKFVTLPNTYLVNQSKWEVVENGPSRSACGLPEQGFVFAGFNRSDKITHDVFGIWMRLLEAIPESILWLFKSSDAAERHLRREAESHGVETERLVFAPRVDDVLSHFARHSHADLFLDTFPYNAHTTASDSLWAGLPLLTYSGRSFASRVAGSLLRTVGLPELVTRSLEEYEALALKLARDRDLLRSYRKRLLCNRDTSPLFDCERFTTNLECAFLKMLDRWRAGLPPEQISVADVGPMHQRRNSSV